MSDHSEFISAQQMHQKINVETSTKCALRCPQCARKRLLAPSTSTQYKLMKQRISAGYSLPLTDAEKLLKFFRKGVALCGSISDPVYWDGLSDFLVLSTQYPDREIEINTAANRPTIEWYREMFSLSHKNVKWVFGLDGMSDTSMIYRQGQDSKLLFDVMLLGKSMGINIEWRFIVFEYNIHQLDDAREFAKMNQIKLSFIKTNRPMPGEGVIVEWKPSRNKEIIKNEN